jgi:hypothetical protein
MLCRSVGLTVMDSMDSTDKLFSLELKLPSLLEKLAARMTHLRRFVADFLQLMPMRSKDVFVLSDFDSREPFCKTFNVRKKINVANLA